MQFWKDETTPFQYGGIVRHDSKVMLYVMFRLKVVLKLVDFQLHHYAVKASTTWVDYARQNLTVDQVTADRKAHQRTNDELTALKFWMQCRYQEEADLELEILQRIRGDVDRLVVHREDRCHHPGNEEEYRRMRQELSGDQNKKGAQGASDQERVTRNQRRDSESQEQQEYARDREEAIEVQQSEPYPSPMSESDPPTVPVSPSQEGVSPSQEGVSPSQEGGVKAKTKVSLAEYRSRRQQQEAAQEKERDGYTERLLCEVQRQQGESIEAQKLELESPYDIQRQPLTTYKREQVHLEQKCVAAEEMVTLEALASQTQHTSVLGSHTPCYDEHGQELDYHDDVPAVSSSEEPNWEEYLCQYEGDSNLEDVAGGAASLEEEARVLQGPTMKSTASEEAMLLSGGGTTTMDMGQFLAGLETFTPTMLSELSTQIEHMCQRATPLASAEPTRMELPTVPPPGLPAIPTVANPMQQALLKAAGDLGTSTAYQHTPTHPPGKEETTRAAAILVEQMSVKAPGAPLHRDDQP